MNIIRKAVNILLIFAMVIHVTIAVILHSRHPEFSAPASIELFNAIFYLIPLLLVNALYLVLKRFHKQKGR